MACVCPVDFHNCPDDMCRGTGICGRNGHELLDRCDRCNQPVNEFIWCNCEPEDADDSDDEAAPPTAQSEDQANSEPTK